MRCVFIDAEPELAEIFNRLHRQTDIPVQINLNPDITAAELPGVVGDAEIIIVDHTIIPTEVAASCPSLRHVVFLGTGARSYMDIEALQERGIEVHIIKGYGDTAVAEMAFALLWSAAKGLSFMDIGVRAGRWLRTEGIQLTGKTVGLLGFGGIAGEFARLALGCGMRVIAWNRTPRSYPGVTFVSLETLLAESQALSVHLLLNDETRGFLSRERIAMMQPGAILVNTARGAVIDEEAMIEALQSGALGHAALDVFTVEPLPADHVLTTMSNVTLSAHSAFRTAEASDNLIEASLEHCRRIAREAT